MRYLVTGGAGFIGSHLVEYLCSQNHDVVVLDNLRTGFKRNISSLPMEFIEGDIRNQELVNEVVKDFDVVFHLAALISVPESLEQVKTCVAINTIGTLNILEAAKKSGSKVVLSTSAAIYGNNPILPKVETMAPEPLSPYAVTKLDAEYYLDIFQQQWQLQTVSLRYFNAFGARQNPKSQYAAAIPIFIERALTNKSIIIYGDGRQTRDFIYVKDIVRANYFASQNGSGVYNVANGNSISIIDLAELIIKLTNSKSQIHYEAERPGDVKHSLANIEKFSTLGFKSQYSLIDGLKETIRYYDGALRKT